MLRIALILAAAFALSLLVASVVQAQSLCFPAEVLGKSLTSRHGERVVARSVLSTGAMIELWEDTRPEGNRSWSLIVLTPDGRRCPVASGHYWERLTFPEGEKA